MMKMAIIAKERYSIIKAKNADKNAFANIIDGKETTVITNKPNKNNIIKVQKDFRLITFDMILPFTLIGFISKVSKKLADAKIPIFVISAYSTDHILIKNRYLEKAISQLTKLGFEIIAK